MNQKIAVGVVYVAALFMAIMDSIVSLGTYPVGGPSSRIRTSV
jgi:hypothetical protein